MGFLMDMRSAHRVRKRFLTAWNSAHAYRPARPGSRVGGRLTSPDDVLHRLGELGNGMGIAAGDTGILAVEFLERLDRLQDFDEAMKAVITDLTSGEIAAVSGEPLSRWVEPDVAVTICEAVATVARPEAYAHALERASDGHADAVPRGAFSAAAQDYVAQERVRNLLEEYHTLRAEPAPLIAEVQRMNKVQEELAQYGIDPAQEQPRQEENPRVGTSKDDAIRMRLREVESLLEDALSDADRQEEAAQLTSLRNHLRSQIQ